MVTPGPASRRGVIYTPDTSDFGQASGPPPSHNVHVSRALYPVPSRDWPVRWEYTPFPHATGPCGRNIPRSLTRLALKKCVELKKGKRSLLHVSYPLRKRCEHVIGDAPGDEGCNWAEAPHARHDEGGRHKADGGGDSWHRQDTPTDCTACNQRCGAHDGPLGFGGLVLVLVVLDLTCSEHQCACLLAERTSGTRPQSTPNNRILETKYYVCRYKERIPSVRTRYDSINIKHKSAYTWRIILALVHQKGSGSSYGLRTVSSHFRRVLCTHERTSK
eukprot:9503761-Pyramimonas_sp.AAC.1